MKTAGTQGRWVVVLGLSLAGHALAAPEDLGKLFDFSKKPKVSAEALSKQFVVEGGKTYFLDGSTKRRLMKEAPSSPKAVEFQRNATISAAKAQGDDGEGPGDDTDAALDRIPLPKKVKAWADYYDPRGSKGKAPPAKEDHTSSMTIVTNQGERGTCAAFAATSALEALMGGGEKLSAEYAYWLFQNKSAKTVCDDPGTDLEAAAKVLRKEGIPNDYFWLYTDLHTCPRADAPQAAQEKATIRARHVYFVPRQKAPGEGAPYSGAMNDPRFLEAVLTSGYNIIGGFTVAWNKTPSDGRIVDVLLDDNGQPVRSTLDACKVKSDGSDNCKPTNGIPQACAVDEDSDEGKDGKGVCVLSGHAMVVMGYVRDAKKHKDVGGGYILLKNSWGADNDGKGYVKLSYDYVRAYANRGIILTGGVKVPDGGKCNDHAQCANFTALGQAGSACCKTGNITQGVCTPLQKDWAGVFYCPAECVGKAGGKPGSCGDLKEDGEECGASSDCAGFKGAGQAGSACCGGVCSPTAKDHAGVFYCKNECVGRPGASAGTCPLIEDGEACKANADCEDFNGLGKEGSACCGGECQPLKKDWAGVYYCAAECKGSAGAAGGTCGKKKAKGEACSDNAQCDGFNGLGKKGSACCGGKCAPMKKDWAGVYYCKADCVGASGASKGTCPLKEKGDSCKVGADCEGSLSCCGGKCRKKLKDWAGVKYCPNECVGKPGGKPGSCD